VDLALSGCRRQELRVKPPDTALKLRLESRAWLQGMQAALRDRPEHAELNRVQILLDHGIAS